MDTWIRSAVRKRVYRQLFAWALVLLAVVVLIATQQEYVRNFIAGPSSVAAADLMHQDDQGRHFVTATGSKVLDTGLELITTESGSKVYHHYYALLVDGKFLIVKGKETPGLKVSGTLHPITTTLAGHLFPDPQDASLQEKTYPLYLSTDNYRKPGYFALAGLVILGFLLWHYARRAWSYAQDLSRHPAVMRAEGWAYAQNTAMLAEREMATEVRYKRPGMLFTQNFVIQRGFFVFNLFRFDDLLWVYKKVTRHSVNFIPTGKSYEGVLVFEDGQTGFGGKEKVVDEMIAFATERAPWAIVGYSEELTKTIQKDPQGFRAVVEARKAGPGITAGTGIGGGL